MVRIKKWLLFLGQKFRFLVQKSNFCHTTPFLVDDPFLALGMTVNFPPWERFFDFPFRSYSCFRKKIRLTHQKVPLWEFRLPVKALALSAQGAGLIIMIMVMINISSIIIMNIHTYRSCSPSTTLLCPAPSTPLWELLMRGPHAIFITCTSSLIHYVD